MAKFGKLLGAATLLGAACAGAVYYMAKKEKKAIKELSMDDVNKTTKEAADFFKEKKDEFVNSREYVVLNEKVTDAKDVLLKTVSEAAEAIKEKANEARDGVGIVSEEEKENAEDFEFEDFSVDEEEASEAEENTAEEVQPEAEVKPEVKAEAEVKPEVRVEEVQPEAEAEVKPEVKAEAEIKPEAPVVRPVAAAPYIKPVEQIKVTVPEIKVAAPAAPKPQAVENISYDKVIRPTSNNQ